MASQKGSQFERDIARALSKWWTHGERDDIFWRSAMSGGMATVRAKKGKAVVTQIGDLVSVDPIGAKLIETYVIELKRGYKAWCMLDLIDSPKPTASVLHAFLEQVKQECETANINNFLLICRRDRRSTIVISNIMFPSDTWIRFKYGGRSYGCISFNDFIAIPPEEVIGKVVREVEKRKAEAIRGREAMEFRALCS